MREGCFLPFGSLEGGPSTAVAEAERVPFIAPRAGSPGLHGRLIRLPRAAGVRTVFMGIDSVSTELARLLGLLSHGMVFAQGMPSPWSRRQALVLDDQALVLDDQALVRDDQALVRDDQAAFVQIHPGGGFRTPA